MRHQRVLICPPEHYTVRDVKNPFMSLENPVNRDLAREQWKGFRATLERCDVEIQQIEPIEDLEDMVFTANQVFAASGAAHARFIVPSRMRHASRQREVPYFVRWFRERGYDVVDLALDGDAYFEGNGDAILQPEANRVWAGCGVRSSVSGIARFAEAMRAESIDVTPLELVDPMFYHLDTCLAPLGADAALYYRGAFSQTSCEALYAGWSRLYPISRADAERFTCNGIAVNGAFIASHVSAAVADVLRLEHLEPEIVDLSEFEKAGGSAFCLKSFLPPARG
jgi:N-dimethylarginine dimethylaminohydrolase